MILVVVVFPVVDDHACVEQAVELVEVQAFVAEAVVERFDVAVAPGLTRRDVGDADDVLAEIGEGFRDEFCENIIGFPRVLMSTAISVINVSAVMLLCTMLSSDSLVCSSTIEAILMRWWSAVASN